MALLSENKIVSMIFDNEDEFSIWKERYIRNGYKITEDIKYYSGIYSKEVYKFIAEYLIEV